MNLIEQHAFGELSTRYFKYFMLFNFNNFHSNSNCSLQIKGDFFGDEK